MKYLYVKFSYLLILNIYLQLLLVNSTKGHIFSIKITVT